MKILLRYDYKVQFSDLLHLESYWNCSMISLRINIPNIKLGCRPCNFPRLNLDVTFSRKFERTADKTVSNWQHFSLLFALDRYIWGGATLFSVWEEWNMLDGSYFCFVSLSTIGFGDFVPGDKIYSVKGIDLSFIMCSMYLMLGKFYIFISIIQRRIPHYLYVKSI